MSDFEIVKMEEGSKSGVARTEIWKGEDAKMGSSCNGGNGERRVFL